MLSATTLKVDPTNYCKLVFAAFDEDGRGTINVDEYVRVRVVHEYIACVLVGRSCALARSPSYACLRFPPPPIALAVRSFRYLAFMALSGSDPPQAKLASYFSIWVGSLQSC
jgi:hypothetical protein